MWMVISNSGKALMLFEKWADAEEDIALLQAQSDIIEMTHIAIGHPEVLKKKELLLVALVMCQDKFDKLAASRNHLIVELSGDGDDNELVPSQELLRMRVGFSSANSYSTKKYSG